MMHEAHWAVESKPANQQLDHLSDEEAELYRDLVECRYVDGVRLEQERVDFDLVVARLSSV